MERDRTDKKYVIESEVAKGPVPRETFPARPDEVADSAQAAEKVLLALALALEKRDNVTAGHCERLAMTSLAIGMSLFLDQESLLALYRGGYLHDIGKVAIPDSILLKPASLTQEEWTIMKTHPEQGAEICGHLRTLAPVVPLVRYHHERWDGTGYPDGLRGNQIPLLARVLQIADIYDALTNSRCYKPAYAPEEAIRIIEDETARGWRDPEIVTQFLRIHKEVLTPVVKYIQRRDCSLMALESAVVNLTPLMRPGASYSFRYPAA